MEIIDRKESFRKINFIISRIMKPTRQLTGADFQEAPERRTMNARVKPRPDSSASDEEAKLTDHSPVGESGRDDRI